MANRIDAYIRLLGAREAQKDLSDVGRGITRLKDGANRAANGMLMFGGAFAAAGALVAKTAISQAAAMEQTRVAFTTLMKSGAAATAMLKDLAEFSARTPFEFNQVTVAAKQLMAFGFQAKEIIPMLTDLGDATGALGIGAEGLQRMIFSLGQMKARGRITGEEIRELSHAGVPVMEILTEKLGLTQKEMRKVADAGVDAGRALKALREGMRERFGGGMEAQARTFNGILSNLRDRLNLFWSDAEGKGVGDKILANVKPAFAELYKELDRLARNGKLAEFARSLGKAITDVITPITRLMTWFAKHPDVAAWGVKIGGAAGAIGLFGGAILKLGAVFVGLHGYMTRTITLYREWAVAAHGAATASAEAAAAGTGAGAGAGAAAGAAGAAAKTGAGAAAGAAASSGGFMFGLGRAIGLWGIPASAVAGVAWMGYDQGKGRRAAHKSNEQARIEQYGGGDWAFDPKNPDKGGWYTDPRGIFGGGERRWIRPSGVYAGVPIEQWGALEKYMAGGKTRAKMRAAGLADDGVLGIHTPYYVSNKGVSKGAAGANADEIAAWTKKGSVEAERNVRDYLRARYGDAAANAFVVTNRNKGAHARYRAIDAVTRNPKALSWEMLAGALRDAGGLMVSNEVGRGNWSKNATGNHLHAYVASEGQKAAATAMEKASGEAKKRAEEAKQAREKADKAAADAVMEAYGLDETPYGQYRFALAKIGQEEAAGLSDAGNVAKARKAVQATAGLKRKKARQAFLKALDDALVESELAALEATGDPKDALTASLRRLGIERQNKLASLGNSRQAGPARLAAWQEYAAKSKAAVSAYEAEAGKPYEDAAADRAKAVQTVAEAQAKAAEQASQYAHERIQAAAQEMADDKALTQAKIDNIAAELNAWYEAERQKARTRAESLKGEAERLDMEGKATEAAEKRAEAIGIESRLQGMAFEQETAVAKVRKEGAATLKANEIARLDRLRAELQVQYDLAKTDQQRYLIAVQMHDLDVAIAKQKGEAAPAPPEPPKSDGQRRAEEWAEAWKERADTVNRALQAIPEAFAARFTDLFRGRGNFLKGLVSDIKNILLDLVQQLIAAWLKAAVVGKAAMRGMVGGLPGSDMGGFGGLGSLFGGLFGGQGGQGGGGILGNVLGGLFGGGAALTGTASAAAAQAGLVAAQASTGLPFASMAGGAGGGMVAKGLLGKIGPAFGAAMIGATLAPMLFGRNNASGAGGGLGAGIGMLAGGPFGAVIGGLAGGLLGSLVRRRRPIEAYTPLSTTRANEYALGAATGGPVNVTQVVNNFNPRPIDGLSQDLAERVGRSIKAR